MLRVLQTDTERSVHPHTYTTHLRKVNHFSYCKQTTKNVK